MKCAIIWDLDKIVKANNGYKDIKIITHQSFAVDGES